MILTDYYRFERVATKSKHRLDCTVSTESYPEFEEKRAPQARRATENRDLINIGDLIVYYHDIPQKFGGDVHRKAGKSLTIKSNNLSSIYVPNPTSNLAYGDVRGTSDAILFVFHNFEVVNGIVVAGGAVDVFIARGKSKDRHALYNLLSDGELDEEMEILKARANNKGFTNV